MQSPSLSGSAVWNTGFWRSGGERKGKKKGRWWWLKEGVKELGHFLSRCQVLISLEPFLSETTSNRPKLWKSQVAQKHRKPKPKSNHDPFKSVHSNRIIHVIITSLQSCLKLSQNSLFRSMIDPDMKLSCQRKHVIHHFGQTGYSYVLLICQQWEIM